MESDIELLATMQERLAELRSLLTAAEVSQKPSRKWIAECVAATGALLRQTPNSDQQFGTLVAGLAWAMWQAGYESAPKLEFVLPEGAGG